MRSKVVIAAVVVAALALALGALAIADRPQYDPYGWLLWGRELTTAAAPFSTADYPSWKPLAALLTVPVSLTGAAAPVVWLVVERLLALGGLVAAYLVGRRLAGRVAGVLAVVSVVLVTGWVEETLDGHLEPAVAGLLLLAGLLDERGRRLLPLALLALAGLARPDAWPALVIYALLMLPSLRGSRRPLAGAIVLAVPMVWFGGDALGSGSALHGGDLSREAANAVATASSGAPASYAVRLALEAPLTALGVAAVALVVVARRERLVLTLGLAALSWLAADVALAASGYPADPRFVMPEAVVASVLGAAGLVRGVRALAVHARGRARRLAPVAAAAALLVASAVPAVATAGSGVSAARDYSTAVRRLQRLYADLRTRGFDRCHPSVSQTFQSPLAWYTHRTIAQVKQPLPDGLAIIKPDRPWRRLDRLMRHAIRYGGLKADPVIAPGARRSVGDWDPVLLAPRRSDVDTRADRRFGVCGRRLGGRALGL